jgi:hypothetical protein
MNRVLTLCTLLLMALPAYAQEAEAAQADGASEASEAIAESAGDVLAEPAGPPLVLPPLEVGLTLGEPSGVTVALELNPAGRLMFQLGMLHRVDPFLFGMNSPAISLGYQHNLLQLGALGSSKVHLTIGGGVIAWPRRDVLRARPLVAVELPVGLRLKSADSPLVISAHVTPQMDVMPHVTPAVVAGLGFSWALGSMNPAPAAAPPEAEVDAPKEEPKPKAKAKSKSKSKKRKRRLSK